jgi:hypothetical protein
MESEQPISLPNENDSSESVEVTKSAPRKRGRPAKKKVSKPEKNPEQPSLLFSSDEDERQEQQERARKTEDFRSEEPQQPVEVAREERSANVIQVEPVVRADTPAQERNESEQERREEQSVDQASSASQAAGEHAGHNNQHGNRHPHQQRHNHENRQQQQGQHGGGNNFNGGRPNHQQHKQHQQQGQGQGHQQGQGKKNKHKNKQFQGKQHRKGGHRLEQEGWSEPELPEQALTLDWDTLQQLSAVANRSQVLDLADIYTLEVQELARMAQTAGVTVSGGLNRRRIQRDYRGRARISSLFASQLSFVRGIHTGSSIVDPPLFIADRALADRIDTGTSRKQYQWSVV